MMGESLLVGVAGLRTRRGFFLLLGAGGWCQLFGGFGIRLESWVMAQAGLCSGLGFTVVDDTRLYAFAGAGSHGILTCSIEAKTKAVGGIVIKAESVAH